MSGMSELALRLDDIRPLDIDLEHIADSLGGEVEGRAIRCPSPGCDPDDRSCFVRIDPARPANFFIYDCEGSTGAAYAALREKLTVIVPSIERPGVRSDAALKIWRETTTAEGTAVETYFRSRAITIPPPPCLRFHPELYHSPFGSHWPAMVAARAGPDGTIAAIHRTFLSQDGCGKAPVDPQRMDLGPAKGTAIQLAPSADELMVGEGIETTMSAMQATGRPGWAAGSAVALRALVLPPLVRSVIILVDGDDAGEGASRSAASRWIGEGRQVRIARAPAGKDFNDILIEESGL
jgi:hypothetical protein